MQRFRLSFFLISLFLLYSQVNYASSLYDRLSEKARAYIVSGESSKALDLYSSMSTISDITKEQRANSLLLRSITLWKELGNKGLAIKGLEDITYRYMDTDAAGDALFFMGLIYEGNGNFKKARKILKSFMKNYPEHMRYENARRIMKKMDEYCDVDNLLVRVCLKTGTGVDIRSESRLFVYPFKSVMDHFKADIINSFLYVNGKKYVETAFLFISDSDLVIVDGIKYRGKISITVNNGKLEVVNIIPLKNYLKSVVPAEMPESWDIEALKSQAVVSRTYALYMMMKNRGKNYDLKSDTWYQMYKGVISEGVKSSEAVQTTESQFMSFKDKPVLAAFHSNSGGRTADPLYFWDEKFPYLNGFKDRFSPSKEWSLKMDFEKLSIRLFNDRWQVQGVRVVKRSPSGRVLKLLLKTDGGLFYIKGDKFRQKMGLKEVKSTLFKIVNMKKGLFIKGRGFGHGIGLSQYGAKNMAEKGYKYKKIIQFYFSGMVSIVKKMPDSLKNESSNIRLSKFF